MELAFANVPRPALYSGSQLPTTSSNSRGGNQNNNPRRAPQNEYTRTRLRPRPVPKADESAGQQQSSNEEQVPHLSEEQVQHLSEVIQQFQLDESQYLELPVSARTSKHPWALIGHWQDTAVMQLVKDLMGDRLAMDCRDVLEEAARPDGQLFQDEGELDG